MIKQIKTDWAARQARVASVISEAPSGVKKALGEAFSGSASPRKAIKAQCLMCVGYDRDDIRNCTAYGCALWAYRPFQQQGVDE